MKDNVPQRPVDNLIGKGAILWVLLGVVFQLKLDIVGEVFVGELICGLFFLRRLVKQRPQFTRAEAVLLASCCTWAAAQLVSDLINRTELADSFKGVGSPLVLMAGVCGFAGVFRSRACRIPDFLIGLGLGALAQGVLWPNEYQSENFWKWGEGQAFLLIGLALAWKMKAARLWLVLPPVLAFALISTVSGARSLAAIPLAGMLLLLAWRLPRTEQLGRFLRTASLPKLLLPTIVGVIAISSLSALLLGALSKADFFSEEVRAKYEAQASAGPGMLLAGRSEVFISGRAFLDSPFVGHGSWAKDDRGYLAEYAALRYRMGYAERVQEMEQDLIPVHSYLMAAFVWAGVVGGFCWLAIANQATNVYASYARLLPLFFHVGIVSFIWNLLFSPFGASARWETSVYLGALFAVARLGKQE